MNYYIQGDLDRAEEIKAAFEELWYDTKHYTFDNDNLLFYTINGDYIPFLDGRIMREAILINIIKTHSDYKELELPNPHYDISNFKPFDRVLVRCGNDEEWMIEFYCKYDTLVHTSPHRDYPFMGIGDSYSQCVPFNDKTKHLLGTTDMCDEMYINW